MVCSEVPHSQAVSAVGIATFTHVGFLRPIPVRSLLRDFHSFHSDLWPGANCSLVGIGSARCSIFADRCSSHNVTLLFEEVVTVALHEGSSSLISLRLGAAWWFTGWRVSKLASCVSPAGYRSANARWGDTSHYI